MFKFTGTHPNIEFHCFGIINGSKAWSPFPHRPTQSSKPPASPPPGATATHVHIGQREQPIYHTMWFLSIALVFFMPFFSKFCRYCSNYYRELADPIEVCDWCQSDGRNSKHGNSSSKSMRTDEVRSAYSSGKIKHDREERTEKVGKSPTSTPSPRTATRRYKLLKDVMWWKKKKINKN